MKHFSFTKMHGLGNDFVVIETITQKITLDPSTLQLIADRHLGVGCDQILVLSPSTSDADFNYRIYNADGSEAEHCGNGARCLAKFIHDNQLSTDHELTLQLSTHRITAKFISDHVIKISMGQPDFALPFTFEGFKIHPVSIGNPHAVIFSDQPPPDLAALATRLSQDPHFPEGVNLSWATVQDPHHIALTVYERGAGFTLACGSAACATAALALNHHQCEGSVVVSMPGGDCTVEWPKQGALYLSGPATTVFTGVWHG
jgi:diaminopimelate epimerase